ncbi:MAG: Asd/ArgC dimerization domain-containing protein [Adlercreutzia equolifaciens]
MDEDVPLVVPEVNPQDVAWHWRHREPELLHHPDGRRAEAALRSPHQARRGVHLPGRFHAGAPLWPSCTIDPRLDGTPEDELEISAFAHRIAFNVIPHIDVFLDDGSTKEEWKMVVETKKIMGDPAIEVAATCVRVPVLRCHGEAINVEFAGEVTVEAARAALEAAPGVEVMDDTANKVYPMPGLLAGTDGTFVGRLRKDPTVPHGIAFWDVADQIRKGAALYAVQIAQLLLP